MQDFEEVKRTVGHQRKAAFIDMVNARVHALAKKEPTLYHQVAQRFHMLDAYMRAQAVLHFIGYRYPMDPAALLPRSQVATCVRRAVQDMGRPSQPIKTRAA